MTKEKEKTFEEKIKELEKVVNELESGEIDLDSSIEKYTSAMKLVKECDDKLKYLFGIFFFLYKSIFFT